MNTLLLITATAFTGLMAGLFYAWSISVTPGIGQVSNENYLQAFKAMNRAILNPAFFIAFMGLLVLFPILLYVLYRSSSAAFVPTLIATLLYVFGVMMVTILGNVTLNNALEALNIEAMSAVEMEQFRSRFEGRWNLYNWIRTICSLLSLIFLVISCIRFSN